MSGLIPDCLHEAWEQRHGHRTCADCKASLDNTPPDALLIEVRRICAEIEGPNKGYQFEDGSRDEYQTVQMALACMKRGIEIGKAAS